jgi:hypothetical protein
VTKIKLLIEGRERAAFIEAALEQYYEMLDEFIVDSAENESDFVTTTVFCSVLLATTIKLNVIEDKQIEVLDEVLEEIRNKYVLATEGFNGDMQ